MAYSDQSGGFLFLNIPPGVYKVFSWEKIDLPPYLGPEFIERYEQEGRSIRLPESAVGTVDLRLIPAR